MMKQKTLFILFILLIISHLSMAQEIIIKGTIKDGSNIAIPGVTIQIKGTSKGAISDIEGNFIIKINKEDEEKLISFSFMGYKTIEFAIKEQRTFNIIMEEESKTLDEVVAVGYGSFKKSDLTGSITSVKVSDIKNMSTSSFDQMLQGRMAGVNITQNSGAPGSETSVRIRGSNSLMGNNEPLYVIDGVPFYNDKTLTQDNSSNGSDLSSGSNPLSFLNQNDIDDIQVLKDASSTAIYGSRGANGVIIITTKKGKQGNAKFNVNITHGYQQITRKMPLLNALEFANLCNESYKRAGNTQLYTGNYKITNGEYSFMPSEEKIKTKEWKFDTDWQEVIFRIAPTTDINMSATGGNDKTSYLFSGQYYNQDGILIGSNYQKGVFRINLDQKLNKAIAMGTNINMSRFENSQVPTASNNTDAGGAVYNALISNPILPVYKESDGTYFSWTDVLGTNYPLAYIETVLSKTTSNNINASFYTDIKILKDLTFKTIFGGKYLNQIRDVYYPKTTWLGGEENGRAALSNYEQLIFSNESYFNYGKAINKQHKITITFGGSWENTQYRTSSNVVSTFPDDYLENNKLSSAALLRAPNNSRSEATLLSVFTRFTYNLLERYMFNLSGRTDGSSKFSENNKWSKFYSVGLAWRLSEEPFIKGLNIFDNLKLKGSYGTSGSQAIKSYQTKSRLGTAGYNLGGKYVTGYGAGEYVWGDGYTGIENKDLTWETTTQLSTGVEMSLIKNRVNFTFDYYKKNTTDLLQAVETPKEFGYTKMYRNIGEIENKGYEFELKLIPIIYAGFQWEINANLSINRNKVIDLGNNNDGTKINDILGPKLSSDGVFNYSGHILRVGQPVGVFYGYKTDGIIQNWDEAANSGLIGSMAQPGEIKYVDISGKEVKPDGVVNDADRTIIGDPNPDYTFGITNKFSYKGASLSIFIQGVQGGDVMNLTLRNLESVSGHINQTKRVLDRWTADNPSNTMPSARLGRSYWMSDRFIQDGSFIRLKNINLSYDAPIKQIPYLKGNVEKLTLSVSASNLYTWTNYFGYDPEVNAFSSNNMTPGVDSGNYPNSKTFIFGMNINF